MKKKLNYYCVVGIHEAGDNQIVADEVMATDGDQALVEAVKFRAKMCADECGGEYTRDSDDYRPIVAIKGKNPSLAFPDTNDFNEAFKPLMLNLLAGKVE